MKKKNEKNYRFFSRLKPCGTMNDFFRSTSCIFLNSSFIMAFGIKHKRVANLQISCKKTLD